MSFRRLIALAIAGAAISVFAAPAQAQLLRERISANIYWEETLLGTNQVLVESQCHAFVVGLAASTYVTCGVGDLGAGLNCPGITCVYARGQQKPNGPLTICWKATATWLRGFPTTTTTTGCHPVTAPVGYANSVEYRNP